MLQQAGCRGRGRVCRTGPALSSPDKFPHGTWRRIRTWPPRHYENTLIKYRDKNLFYLKLLKLLTIGTQGLGASTGALSQVQHMSAVCLGGRWPYIGSFIMLDRERQDLPALIFWVLFCTFSTTPFTLPKFTSSIFNTSRMHGFLSRHLSKGKI